MIGTEEYNNKTTRMNKSSIICDKIKYLRSKSVSEFFFKLCSYENIKTGVKCGLNHKKIPYVAKLNIRNYILQKNRMFSTIMLRKMLVSRRILRIMV